MHANSIQAKDTPLRGGKANDRGSGAASERATVHICALAPAPWLQFHSRLLLLNDAESHVCSVAGFPPFRRIGDYRIEFVLNLNHCARSDLAASFDCCISQLSLGRYIRKVNNLLYGFLRKVWVRNFVDQSRLVAIVHSRLIEVRQYCVLRILIIWSGTSEFPSQMYSEVVRNIRLLQSVDQGSGLLTSRLYYAERPHCSAAGF